MRKLLALTLMLMLLMAPVTTVVYAKDDPVEEEGGTEGGDETPNGDEGDEGTGDDDVGDDDEEDHETDDETDDEEDTDDDEEELTEDETDDDGDDETDDDEENDETDEDDDDDETDDEDEDEEDDEDKPLDPELLDELLNQAYDAQLGVNATMNALMSQFSPVSPAGRQSYLHGGEAIALALRFMNENQTHAAANQIQRALKHYKNVLRMLYDEDPEALEELEEEPEDVEEPPEVEGNETAAIKGAKLKLMEQFEGNLQERISLFRETMENATDQLSEQDAQKIWDALERAEAKLERMQQRLNNSEVDEAIDEAEDAEDEIEEGLEGLEDKTAGQMLKTIYRLEAKLLKMENIRDRKAEKGLNVSGDDDDIDEAKGNLKGHKENWKGGKFGPTDAGNGDGEGGIPDAGKPDVTPGMGSN